ncbi:MAG TPA: divergent polysaccharide deacetylase family protein, partial [Candidatus Acidoferrales bacterium]|nr:divergent polysaccharide deacetylase family protein [Candidatus Acidoferrales bacterium]
AAARTAAGTESPIRIVPATSSRTAAPTRVFVTLPGTARLAAVEDAWRAAAEKDGVKFERAGAGPDAAVYSLTAGGQSLLLLEVFQLEGGSGGAPAEAANSGNGPASALASGAQLAVIVDDLGYDPAAARAALSLPGRVSVAILPNLPDSSAIAEEAFRRGVEVLLHLPMQSLGGDGKAEKIELRVGEPAGEVNRVLGEMLASVPHAVGVNNHQGSRATADAALMAALAGDLRERGLFFIDSRTSGASIALDAARRAGVPAAGRNVFLDDDEQPAAIRKQLERAEHVAREQGFCVAIGHPHNATLDVLAERLPEIEARGVRLVFASEILKSAAGTR